MSRSGVAVGDEVQQAFQELKLGKSVKYIIFKLNGTKTEIVVDSKGTEPDYDAFLSKLPEDDGRYAVYDFEYDSGEGKRNKIVFYTWSPDTAPVRSKMVYAASKDALRRSLNGIATEIQGTDFSEVAFESVLDKITRQTGSH